MEVCELASSGLPMVSFGLIAALILLVVVGVLRIVPRHHIKQLIPTVIVLVALGAPVAISGGVYAAGGPACPDVASTQTGVTTSIADSDQEDVSEPTSLVTAVNVQAPFGENCGGNPEADLPALAAATTTAGNIDWDSVDLDPSTPGRQSVFTTGQYSASVDSNGLVTIVLVGNPEFMLAFTVANDLGAVSNTAYIDVFINTTCD